MIQETTDLETAKKEAAKTARLTGESMVVCGGEDTGYWATPHQAWLYSDLGDYVARFDENGKEVKE